jgi:hypothetical protein
MVRAFTVCVLRAEAIFSLCALSSPPRIASSPWFPLSVPAAQIDFILLISRQGKVRLTKWYTVKDSKERTRLTREVSALVLNRAPKMCNFLEYKDKKLVYKRYASLFFVMCIGKDDNELITLEMIHQYVEVRARVFRGRRGRARPPRRASLIQSSPPTLPHSLTPPSLFALLLLLLHLPTPPHQPPQVLDKYFGNVCELDIIFNFHKAYFILDEIFIGGELQETNKREVLRVIVEQDRMAKQDEEGIVRD